MKGKKPGRKSADELNTPVISALEVKRPKPPAELSDPEKQTWEAITSTMPPDWWRPGTYPLLASYVRHVQQARELDRLLRGIDAEYIQSEDDWVGATQAWDRLLRARDRESRALVNLARSMRLSQQAQMHPRSAGRRTDSGPSGVPPHLLDKKPWE